MYHLPGAKCPSPDNAAHLARDNGFGVPRHRLEWAAGVGVIVWVRVGEYGFMKKVKSEQETRLLRRCPLSKRDGWSQAFPTPSVQSEKTRARLYIVHVANQKSWKDSGGEEGGG